MVKTVAVVAVMLVAFLAGVPIALVAIAGAAYTLFTRRVKPEKVYREINWQLLVLFVGLFVLTGGIEKSGLVGDLMAGASAIGLSRPAMITMADSITPTRSSVPIICSACSSFTHILPVKPL